MRETWQPCWYLMWLFQCAYLAVSSMRTGTKVNLTATSCQVRTVRWWCGTMTATGAMCHVTTTCHTPARRVSVSFLHFNFSVVFQKKKKVIIRAKLFPAAFCGEPPQVRYAKVFGKKRSRYETNSKVRYYCQEGFVQKLNPVIKCLADGQWEEPLITCIPSEFITCSGLYYPSIHPSIHLFIQPSIHPSTAAYPSLGCLGSSLSGWAQTSISSVTYL